MKKIIFLFALFITLGVVSMQAQTASLALKTAAYKTWNTDYTLTNTVPDTFVFDAARNYPATQSYSIHIDSTSGNHTNIAVAFYGSLLGVSYTQIGSTVNYVTGFSSTHDTTITISNTTANRYNYYKAIVTGTGTGVATIDWQRLQIWSAGELSDGTATLSAGSFTGLVNISTTGNVTVGATSANETTPHIKIVGDADSDAGGDTDETLTIDLTANATPTSATWDFTSTQSAGYTFDKGIRVAGPINSAILGGTNVVSAGLLGGGGTSTSATQTLGAAGGKAFSYYLSSTSTTASDVLTGYYMNVNYGTSGSSAAPSGDVIRGRAWLVGDASGSSAVTGGAFTVELAAETASNTGLTAGLRGNLVFPSAVLTNSGTFYGTMAEVFLGGAATNTNAYTEVAPLGIVVGGTSPTAASQVANMVAIAIRVPSNMVTSDATMVCTGGAADTCDAKLKISINGTNYWIMLSTDDE